MTINLQKPDITELKPRQQLQIPSLSYQSHMYSSDILQRWVKINEQMMYEQQWLNSDIQIISIQPQFLILEMGHIRFSVPALEDWQGQNS